MARSSSFDPNRVYIRQKSDSCEYVCIYVRISKVGTSNLWNPWDSRHSFALRVHPGRRLEFVAFKLN
jgi:hypothetical protein